jgi:uncharacterized protein YbbC (DUF1343 family)
MVYGMTPGEAAQWIVRALDLRLDLRIVRMRDYGRQAFRRPDWPPWIPPSPAIVSWESALCYPATVFTEAFGALNRGQGTGLDFQILAASWIRSEELCEALSQCRLKGVSFHRHPLPAAGARGGGLLDGVRLTVVDPQRFRPAATSVHILSCLQTLYGRRRVWRSRDARPAFFDTLFGTPTVRESLLDNERPERIAAAWRPDLAAFRKTRSSCLLYEKGPAR